MGRGLALLFEWYRLPGLLTSADMVFAFLLTIMSLRWKSIEVRRYLFDIGMFGVVWAVMILVLVDEYL